MPTTRPRYQVTETSVVERALETALQRWPGEPKSRLLVRLIELGAETIAADRADMAHERRRRLDALAGAGTGMYESDYRERLRDEWPA